MKPVQGGCLCGAVRFSITGKLPKLYQCHCSECRRATGSSHNSSLLIATPHFSWLQGEALVTHFRAESGYNVHFCALCSSPVPNPIEQADYYWVPAGALDAGVGLEVGAHLCVASKASWEEITSSGTLYQAMPEFSQLLALLESEI